MHIKITHGFLDPSQGKKTHKHKQICGSVPGLGGCQNFVYVFFRVIPYGGGKKHIGKAKIAGQSRENFVYVFFLYSGISKPVVWGTRGLHPGFPWFSSLSWFP